MRKITLLIFVVIFVFCFISSAQATLWAERQDNYQSQSDSCVEFENVEVEFDWEEYQDIAENGNVEEIKKLISDYREMVSEYAFFENKIGVLYYDIMILSLKTVYFNRFESSNLESEEYKKNLQDLDKKTKKLNNIISQCNFSWE